MVDDGLVKRFPKPDIALGQHVMSLPAGQTRLCNGPLLSRSDSLKVTLFGRGGHSPAPETTVDPVVMAAATVMRLQTVVSREIALTDDAAVTVGSLQAGSSANIFPNEAVLEINIRTFNDCQAHRDKRGCGVGRSEAADDHHAGAVFPHH